MKKYIALITDNIEWIISGLLFLILPIIYVRYSLDPVLFPRYLALSIWTLVLTFILIIKTYLGKFEFRFSAYDKIVFIVALLFVLLNAVSAIGSFNIAEAIFKTFKEFTLMLSFFYFFQMMKNDEKVKDIFIKAAIIMAAIFLAVGYYQLADSDFTKFRAATSDYAYWFRQAIADVKSTLANILPFATILFLSLPFSTFGLIAYKKLWRLFSFLVWGSSLFFIFILASKGAWGALGLAAFVGVLLVFIYIFQIMPKQLGTELPIFAKVGVLLLPFILFFVTLFLAEKTDNKIVKVVFDKVGQVLSPEKSLNAMYNTDKPSSTQTRTLVWANTIQMARDYPVLGVGPGQWKLTYAKYGIDAFASDIRNGTKTFQRPHNDLIWILGELGFTGLILYLFIFISILTIAYRNFKSNEDFKVKLFNGLAFSFLIGYLIILNVDFSRERISHNVLYLLLFAIVLSYNRDAENKKNNKINKSTSTIILIIFAGLSIYNLSLAKDMFNGDKAARKIYAANATENMPLMARGVRDVQNTSYTLDPFSMPIPYYQGIVLLKQGKIEEAKQEFLKAVKLNPYHILVLANLGTAYDNSGDKESAIMYYQKALDISPRFKEALIDMAIVKYNQNKFDEALGYLIRVQTSESVPPSYEKALLTISRKKAILLVKELDAKKLQEWFYNENKIKATFVKFQTEKGDFDKILLQEIGK